MEMILFAFSSKSTSIDKFDETKERGRRTENGKKETTTTKFSEQVLYAIEVRREDEEKGEKKNHRSSNGWHINIYESKNMQSNAATLDETFHAEPEQI